MLLRRLLLSACVAIFAFSGAFLVIFVPLVLWDLHMHPHDGQGGLGEFLLAAPIAFLSLPFAGIWAFRRKWPQLPEQ